MPRRFFSFAVLFGGAVNIASAQDAATLEPVTVEAARTGQAAELLPFTTTVIDREQIEQQLALGGDIAQLIGNMLPSFSPSRQKLSGFGETLRGREPLFLIDGVPQSNPLRNGSRDGYVIDPGMVERIEIIHGANAIQGAGATGGIINFITKTADSGPPDTRASIQFSTNDDFTDEAFGERLHVQHAQDMGNFDWLAAAGYTNTGLFLDAEDRPIGVDTTQGETMDGEARDLFTKLGYDFGAQRLQLTVNRFDFGSDGDYVEQPGDRAAGVPTSAMPGDVAGEPAENAVTTVSFDYRHEALAAGRLHWQVYRQDFASIFGGGAFDVFQDPALGAVLFDQSRNQSEKTGSKLTYNLPGVIHPHIDFTGGLDYIEDTTFQDLVQTGRKWVPETNYVNWAPFLQIGWALSPVQLTAGVRREHAKLDVDDFMTLAFYNNTLVQGGSPEFNETLTNFGANWTVTDNWTLFGSRSEGFSMPDVGRVLRAIDQPGQNVDDFLDLQPIVADNRELGVQFRDARGEFRASYFESESELGARLVADVDGIFSVQREMTEIDGFEARAALNVTPSTRFGAQAALLDGRIDLDGDGSVDSDLGGINIAPDRANLFWEQRWPGMLDSRLQLNHLRGRDFEEQGEQVARFDGYNTWDLIFTWQLGEDQQLRFAVENLADEQYITYFSQVTDFPSDLDYFAGRGRQFYVTWRGSFF